MLTLLIYQYTIMLGTLSWKRAAARYLSGCVSLMFDMSPISACHLDCKAFSAITSSSSWRAALVPGATFTLTKRFSAPDVEAFVQISGDFNPIHTQPEAARAAGLPGPILPGMLSASLFPAIIGSTFPGALYLSQTLKFKQYTLVGESLTATLRVDKASGSRVCFLTQCRNTDSGELVVEGTALALIGQPEKGP